MTEESNGPATSSGPAEGIPDPTTRAGADAPEGRRGGGRTAAASLAAVLALVIAAVATAPFWAPPVMALLPWGPATVAAGAAPNERLAALERQFGAAKTDIGQLKSAVGGLSSRIDQLGAAGGDAAQLKAALAALAHQVDQLAAAQQNQPQQLQQMQQQLAALQAKVAAQPTVDPAAITAMQQQLAGLAAGAATLENRVGTVEKAVTAAPPGDPTETALLLALVQMREAVQQGKPFEAQYNAFEAIAHAAPDIAAAAAPLADAAKNGVASRTVLTQRLSDLAGRIASARRPPPHPDWGEQALAKLRGLVTIRRVDGPNLSEPEAALSAAQQALAKGDLAAAVAAMDKLPPANAEAAAPWLGMARARLQVENALDKVEQLLIARLVPVAAKAPRS